MGVTPWLAIVLVLLLTGASLTAAGALRDRGVAPHVTRWVAAVVGGLAYLIAVLWLDAWSAVALSVLSVLAIALLRMRRSSLLKGLRWSARETSRAELGYPAAASLALAVGWAALNDPWLAFLAIAFMAWGDASAGLVRGFKEDSLGHTVAASAAMAAVSLCSAWLIYPSVAGAAAALGATGAEALWPLTRSKLSDSWPVVGSALGLVIVIGGTS
jgi:dolichol kinase